MKLYSDAELAQILDKKIFHKIGEVADEMHVECYLVGGYVRDIFLERPTNDIDVVVVGSGIDALLLQFLGHHLRVLPRQAVDDARIARSLRHSSGEVL